MTEASDAVGPPGEGLAARFEFDPASDDVVVEVVEAVDELATVEGTDFEAILHDAIDPDALRRCLDSGGPDTQVFFRFGEYSVTAASEGEILISR